LAAAVRFADEERALDERLLPDDDRLLPDDDRLLPDDDRLPPDDRLPEDRLLPEDERLRELADERLEPLDFFLPPEPPLLRRSAMSGSPS
jgi:hypothetical protein